MNYQLVKEVEEAGFPQGGKGGWLLPPDILVARSRDRVYVPTLEELIEACGDEITSIYRADKLPEGRVWVAKCCDKETHVGIGSTPTEAVARLWLALNREV